MRRAAPFAMSPLLVVLAAGWLAGPAAADCSSPYLSVTPPTVRPGEPVLIVGQAFGTDCRDYGPPDGRALGEPQRAISIYVDQQGSRHLVAVVDADAEYRFAVAPSVPVGLPEGEGAVVAVSTDSGSWFPETSAPLVVAGAPVRMDDPPVAVAVADAAASDGVLGDEGEGWFSVASFAVGAGATALVAAVLVVWLRRPRRST